MKLPSSSSSPSCSTASASPSPYHLNSDAATAGCLSGIIRRLICRSLDVGSSARSRVADAASTDGVVLGAEASEKAWSLKPPAAAPPAPGIVARLMGLETMPALPSAPPGPMGRSRSTGSLDGWPVLLPVPAHRRSHSFREAPTFLRQESDEFLLLSFSPEGGEEKKISEPLPKAANNHDMGLRELDQGDNNEEDETQERPNETERPAVKMTKKQQQQKKKNVRREISREKVGAESCRRHAVPQDKAEARIKTQPRGTGSAKTKTTATIQKETPARTRATTKKGDKKKSLGGSKTITEPECSSQNSSPVSVLDRLPELDGESLTDTSTPISDAEEEQRPEGSPRRRKLSSQLDCFNDPSPLLHLILVEEKEGPTPMEVGSGVTRHAASVAHSSSDLWAGACRLAEGDVQQQPWKTQDPEEIVVEFGLQILEGLLQETVAVFYHAL